MEIQRKNVIGFEEAWRRIDNIEVNDVKSFFNTRFFATVNEDENIEVNISEEDFGADEWNDVQIKDEKFLGFLWKTGESYTTSNGVKIKANNLGDENIIVKENKKTGEVIIVNGENVQVEGGKNNDKVAIINSTVGKVTTGKGDDTVVLYNADTSGKIDTGKGNDSIVVANSDVNKINSSSGKDNLSVVSKSSVKNIELGSGNDYIYTTNSEINKINSGSGLDVIENNWGDIKELKTGGFFNSSKDYVDGNIDKISGKKSEYNIDFTKEEIDELNARFKNGDFAQHTEVSDLGNADPERVKDMLAFFESVDHENFNVNYQGVSKDFSTASDERYENLKKIASNKAFLDQNHNGQLLNQMCYLENDELENLAKLMENENFANVLSNLPKTEETFYSYYVTNFAQLDSEDLENFEKIIADKDFQEFHEKNNIKIEGLLKLAQCKEFSSLEEQDRDIILTAIGDGDYSGINPCTIKNVSENFDKYNEILNGKPTDPEFAQELKNLGDKYGITIKAENHISTDPNNRQASIYINESQIKEIDKTLAKLRSMGETIPQEIYLCDIQGAGGVFTERNKNAITINVNVYSTSDSSNIFNNSISNTLIHETAHLKDYQREPWYFSKEKAYEAGIIDSKYQRYKSNPIESIEFNDTVLTGEELNGIVSDYATTDIVEFVAEVETMILSGIIVQDENGNYTITNGDNKGRWYCGDWTGSQENHESLQKIMNLYKYLTEVEENDDNS